MFPQLWIELLIELFEHRISRIVVTRMMSSKIFRCGDVIEIEEGKGLWIKRG